MDTDWTSLSDQELLECRISKLGLKLEGSGLEALIKQLYDELSAKELTFHPRCHIGDEWFIVTLAMNGSCRSVFRRSSFRSFSSTIAFAPWKKQ